MVRRAHQRKDRPTPTQARAARRARRRTRRRAVRIGAFVLVGLIAMIFSVSLIAGNLPISIGGGSTEEGPWERFPDQGRTHISPGIRHPPYNSVPATSGWHYDIPLAPERWGVHDRFLVDEVLIHNLEHGGVGVHYNCPEECDELVEQLAAIVRNVDKVIMSPYPGMDARIALTAWNFIDRFDEFDELRVENFINTHINSTNAPEPLAR